LFETKKLRHNLIEINAKQKQAIENFMPLQKIIDAPDNKAQKYIITAEIAAHPDDAMNLILDMIKHNKAMQTEFDAFSKMNSLHPIMNFKSHKVRQVKCISQ
jgi:hypothetical protein